MSEFNNRIADLESILLNCTGDHTPEEIADMEAELARLHKLEPVNDELQKIPVDRGKMTTLKPWCCYGAGTYVSEIDTYCMDSLGFSVDVDADGMLAIGRLMERKPQPEHDKPDRPWTFDFVPDKVQPRRNKTCLTACCKCDDGYEVAYKFDYEKNTLDVVLTKDGISAYTKDIDLSKAGASIPATLQEAEERATDAVTGYVANTGDINVMVPIFSRLRTWTDGNGRPRTLNRYKSHVYVSNYDHQVVHVETDGGSSYDVCPGQKVMIRGIKVHARCTVNTRHGKARCQLVFIDS